MLTVGLSPLTTIQRGLQDTGDGEYWQPNDEQANNHEGLVYVNICEFQKCQL